MISNEMKEYLASGESTCLAAFLKITALDGTTLRVWNGTFNIIVDGETYLAYPIAPSQLQQSNELKADNLEALVAYYGEFSREKLKSKKWAGARVEYTVRDYKNLSLGPAERRSGFVGETQLGKFSAKPEFLSLSSKLAQPVVFTYQEDCNVVEFADARCGVDPTGWTRSGYKIRANGVIAAPILNRQQFSVNFTETVIRGLRAKYYNGANFGSLADQSSVAALDFASSMLPPSPNTSASSFSARFEGTIAVPSTGTWTFKITHDNGASLTINGTSLINVWTTDGMNTPATTTASIALTAGTNYPVVADWNSGGPPGVFRMFWSKSGYPEEIVPASAFTPASGVLIKNNLYERGKIKFLTGANAGSEQQILTNTANALTLYLPLPFPVAAGDTVQLTTGCNRKIETCVNEYGNGPNNRSFFTLPGRNKLFFPE